jgi:hypothetical protein
MPLQGSAFLALWNDVEPDRRAEYDEWHTFEHVPERVGIAGFLAGRRYVAPARSDRRYFTLYDLGALEALQGSSYLDVVERPTDWSLSMRPLLRDVVRRTCATVATLGLGMGGSVAAIRFGTADPAAAADAGSVRAALQPLLATSRITAVHLGHTIATPPPASMGGLGWDQAAEGAAQQVLIVEALEQGDLDTARPLITAMLREQLHAVGDIDLSTYDLAFAVERFGLPSPTSSRQPARPDLHGRWNRNRRAASHR